MENINYADRQYFNRNGNIKKLWVVHVIRIKEMYYEGLGKRYDF
jgi:hypothetical protein